MRTVRGDGQVDRAIGGEPVRHLRSLRGNARSGPEDTLLVRRGEPATSNAQLVEWLVGIVRAIEREPARVDDAEQLFSLPGMREPHA
jgi:hypothetical protein